MNTITASPAVKAQNTTPPPPPTVCAHIYDTRRVAPDGHATAICGEQIHIDPDRRNRPGSDGSAWIVCPFCELIWQNAMDRRNRK